MYLELQMKENAIGNARQSGNMGGNNSKNVVWDPNDIARTTIKEMTFTIIEVAILDQIKKGVAYDPVDVALNWKKQINIHDTRSGNMEFNSKRSCIWILNDVARTTKETDIHDTRTGNMESRQRGTAYDHGCS